MGHHSDLQVEPRYISAFPSLELKRPQQCTSGKIQKAAPRKLEGYGGGQNRADRQHLLKLGLCFGDLLVVDGVLQASLLLVELLVLGEFLALCIQFSQLLLQLLNLSKHIEQLPKLLLTTNAGKRNAAREYKLTL